MKRFFLVVAIIFFFASTFAQTKTEIKTSAISQGISEYISKNFSGYTIMKAFKVDNKGVMSTEVVVSKGLEKYKLAFSKEGRLVKKEALKPDTKVIPVKGDKKPVVK